MTINRPGQRGCTYSLACPGQALLGRTRCLEHPRDTHEWSYALNGVALGLISDFSGVTFSPELFAAVRGAAGSSFGAARFEEAVFHCDTDFSDFEFTGATSFSGARFRGEADFRDARFHGPVSFADAEFEQECSTISSPVLMLGGPVSQLDTVLRDAPHGGAFLDGAAQLDAYRRWIAEAQKAALGVVQSKEFIHDLARQI